MLLLPIAIGLPAALAAQAFVQILVWLHQLWLSPEAGQSSGFAAPWLLVLVPTFGGLAVGVLRRFAGPAHGPAEIIAAVQTRAGHLKPGSGRNTAAANLISLGAGAPVGEYGPLVHLGGSLGCALARRMKADTTAINTAMACGVAAAIATVFNAPIAAILFAHEIVLRHFSPRAFAPVALAAITGFVVGNAVHVRSPLLASDASQPLALWSFPLFAVLGVLAAGLALTFMHAILGAQRAARRLPGPDLLHPCAAGLLLGLAGLWLPELLGMGFALLDDVTSGTELPLGLIAVLLAGRLLASALALGLGFSGGVFAPALVIGALFGSLMGQLLAPLDLGPAAPALFATCGMVAVTAPVIGAPVTAVVIVLELTGSYPWTLAALAAVAIANFITARRFGRSLFDRQLVEQRLDLSAGRSKAMLEARTIGDLIDQDALELPDTVSAGEACHRLVESGHSTAYLIDGNRGYRGSVGLLALQTVDADRPAVESRNRDEVVMREQMSLYRAMQRLRNFDGETVAMIDERGILAGVLHPSRLIASYLDLQSEIRAEEQIRHE